MKIHTNFAKLTGLWNKQTHSPQAAEDVKNEWRSLLITLGATRWNSTYDAVAKVHSIIKNLELEVKFDKLCDKIISKRLLPQQKTFIEELVEVMAPSVVFLMYYWGKIVVALVTHFRLSIMKSKLLELIHRQPPLVICQPLVQAILNGLQRRF